MFGRAFRRWRDRRAAARVSVSPHGHAELSSPTLLATTRKIGVLIYPGVTTGEVDAPVAALANRLQADVAFIGRQIGPVTGIEPVRMVSVDEAIDTVANVDVLVVPGGLGWERLVADDDLMRWVVTAAGSARGVLAISTGSLILGAAGHLAGKKATGHWLAREQLAAFGATVVAARTASSEDNLLVTASGAMAALELIDDFADRVRWGP